MVLMSRAKTGPMMLDLYASGNGEFYHDIRAGPEYRIEIYPGDTLGLFLIRPAEEWVVGSVILVAGDGTIFDKTADALAGALIVSYSELTDGDNNRITVTFVLIPPVKDADGGGGGFPLWPFLLPILIFLLLFLMWERTVRIIGRVTAGGEPIADAAILYSMADSDGGQVIRNVPVTTDVNGRYVIFVQKGWTVTIEGASKNGRLTTGATSVKDGLAVDETLYLTIPVEERIIEVNLTM
jgi:hypothetical protein